MVRTSLAATVFLLFLTLSGCSTAPPPSASSCAVEGSQACQAYRYSMAP